MNTLKRITNRPAMVLAAALLLTAPAFGQEAAPGKEAEALPMELVLGGSIALLLLVLLLVFLLMTFVQLLPSPPAGYSLLEDTEVRRHRSSEC